MTFIINIKKIKKKVNIFISEKLLLKNLCALFFSVFNFFYIKIIKKNFLFKKNAKINIKYKAQFIFVLSKKAKNYSLSCGCISKINLLKIKHLI